MMAEKLDVGYTRFSQVVALILIGWFASSWWYQTGAFEKVRAEARCEHWRADKDEGIAKMAIKGANSDSAPIPDAKSLPRDSCNKGSETALK